MCDASAGYSNVIIRLDKDTANLLHASAIVLEDKVQGLTNNIVNPKTQQLFYTKGLYPPSYETKNDPLSSVYDYPYNRTIESAKFPWLYKHVNIPSEDKIHFNPDKIYPGERFVLIVPTEYVVLPEGKIPDSFFANLWVGIEFSGGYTHKVAGINGKIGIAFRAGALIDDNVPGQIIVFLGGGGHAGIGLGKHGEINFVFIVNAPKAQNIAGLSWGFDWDLVFGGLSAKSMTKGTKEAYEFLTKVFKKGEISKILGIGKKNTKYIFNYKTLQKWAQYLYGLNKSKIKTMIHDALKNIGSNLQSSGPVYTIKVPSSYLTQFIGIKESAFGKHFFIGAKAEETIVKIIYPEVKPEKLTDWYTYIGQETSTIASNNGSDIQVIDVIDFKKFA